MRVHEFRAFRVQELRVVLLDELPFPSATGIQDEGLSWGWWLSLPGPIQGGFNPISGTQRTQYSLNLGIYLKL